MMQSPAGANGPEPLDPGAGLTERIVTLPDGRRLRTVVAGEGPGPLVVFEAGMSAPAAEWNHVQRTVSAHARTLAYDRAGYGSSDVDAHDRTLHRMADDLADLLDAVEERGPVVLVAHSWGGPIIRVFAHLRPARVAGIVFVEGTLAEVMSPKQANMTKWSFHLTSLLIRLGMDGAIRRLVLPHGPSAELSEEDFAIMWRDYASVRAMRAGVQEAKQAGAAQALMRELQAAGTPDVPTIALQAGRLDGGAATRELRRRFTEATRTLMDAQPQGRLIIVEGAGHLLPQEKPAAVERAIMDALVEVGGRTPPPP